MHRLTEFEKGQILELVWQEPESPKELNCLVFESYHI